MKIAQEIRAGNVIMQGKDPMVVLKTEYSRGGRNAATVRMKMKNLLNGAGAAGLPPIEGAAWGQAAAAARARLLAQDDLTHQLLQFVLKNR